MYVEQLVLVASECPQSLVALYVLNSISLWILCPVVEIVQNGLSGSWWRLILGVNLTGLRHVREPGRYTLWVAMRVFLEATALDY